MGQRWGDGAKAINRAIDVYSRNELRVTKVACQHAGKVIY